MKIPKRIIATLTVGAIVAVNSAPAIVSAQEVVNENPQTTITLESNQEEPENNKELEQSESEVSEESKEITNENPETDSTDTIIENNSDNLVENKETEIIKEESIKNNEENIVSQKEIKALTLNEAIENSRGYYKQHKNNLTEWWEMVVLDYIGENINSNPYKLETWGSNLITPDTSVVNDAGKLLGLLARGEDPKNYQGKDWAKVLADKQNNYKYGSFNGGNFNLWAMISLEICNQEYDREFALETLLKLQNPKTGGYSMSDYVEGQSHWASVDMTGMALIALSFYKDDARAQDSINKAVQYLEDQTRTDGLFGGDSNSTAMAITGLLAAGKDINSQTWSGLKDGLISMQLTEEVVTDEYGYDENGNYGPQKVTHYPGEFYWKKSSQTINSIATYQSLIALSEYKSGNSMWHNMAKEYDLLEDQRELSKLPKIHAQTIVANIGDKIDLLKNVSAEDKDGNPLDVKIVNENVPKNAGIVTKDGLYSVTYKAVDSDGREQIKLVDVKINKVNNLTIIDDESKVESVMKKLAEALKEVDENGNLKYSLEEKEVKNLEDDKVLYTFILSENTNTKNTGARYEIRMILSKDNKAPELPILAEKLNEIPVISINNESNIKDGKITVRLGEKVDLLKGVEATDAEDGKVDVDVIEKSEGLDDNYTAIKVGSYDVVYEAKDSKGATARKSIKLIINDKKEDPKEDIKDENNKVESTNQNKNPQNQNGNKNNPTTGDVSIATTGVVGLVSILGLAVLNRRKK
ncbi:hypothetical protein CHL78_007630 [Romboutsia weinsteinii]|uniref:DUF5011 domain-containing protein n=1 Tax=Romboutsia weinsteinii TaxID=2020949 RepID=A0A371J552_9FIRM|nr:prenyltransferase/squalene oxidase repeat-containing protein [Romboutsia weinsteinii]RDY27865.1 hypothetical protein CHL78_007630 [Romboutsia weinsteinii]